VVIDLSGSLPIRPARSDLPGRTGQLRSRPRSLHELAALLRALAAARWLEGAVFRLDGLEVTYPTAYALRRLIHEFRESGKFATAFLSTISRRAYYVACAADEVIAPETADVRLHGVGVCRFFFGEALARLGVRFEKVAVGEAKTAMDGFARHDMSPAERQQLEAILAELEDQFTKEVAIDRHLPPARVRAAIDEGATSAQRLEELGLVDRVAYEDEVVGAEKPQFAEAQRFLPMRASGGGKSIAVVSLTGLIVPGSSAPPRMLRPSGISSSDAISRALRLAAADERVGAVVLHVDSPGGSALASDLIWRAVRLAGASKPVVALMGAVAASGGYYAAAAARHVVAAPATITGSIGVVTGKFVADGLLERHGIRAELLERGPYALVGSPARALSKDERGLLERSTREVYARFVARVADGRRIAPERVDALGQGRIWLGSDAVKVGLVDELGDWETALSRAAELAGISRDAPIWDVPTSIGAFLSEATGVLGLLRSMQSLLSTQTQWLVCPLGLHGLD
jgi:protease-4